MSGIDLYRQSQIEQARRAEERRQAEIARMLRQERGPQPVIYRRILVVLQGREADEAVLNHVQALAAQVEAQVTLLRVIPIADDGGGLGRQWQLEAGSRGWRRKRQAEAVLPRLARRLEQAGLDVETAVVIGARAEADEIVAYAAEHGCDLIAMPSDPRPWYARWLGHSQAGAVQRKAAVPTLFVGAATHQPPARRTAPKANRWMALLGEPHL